MTIKEVEKVVMENGLEMVDFYKFMEGQTIGIMPGGADNYYEHDVEKFISMSKRGNKLENDSLWD